MMKTEWMRAALVAAFGLTGLDRQCRHLLKEVDRAEAQARAGGLEAAVHRIAEEKV